jgi:ankyrin repeat protein
MKTLPASPDLSHLKKQAKALLRAARAGENPALQRFAEALPAARGLDAAALAQHELRLHDAQSVIARDYGFKSWTELKRTVEWLRSTRAEQRETWLGWVFDGNSRARKLAVRTLHAQPSLFADDPWLACVIGNEAILRDMIARDPAWVNRRHGPRQMVPLLGVTQSRLILEEGYEAPLLACAALLLQAGADVNATWTDPHYPDWPLSALYGAAGITHHPGMTRLLLEAGANPNDNESLYHSVEGRDPACTLLLLEAGARVVGTNTIGRVLDYDKPDLLRLLLAHGGNAAERPWLHHAILRGRSMTHIRLLLDAGADPRAVNHDGISLYRWAQLHGRDDVVEALRALGVEEALSEEETFIAACTRGDTASVVRIQSRVPDIVSRLSPRQLQTLPELAAVGALDAVRCMLAAGWPREVKAGWDATALNLAVFQGDAAMASLLLEQGADWRTRHGYGDNVVGTLSYASQADDIEDPAPRDYIACARALIDHGVPVSATGGYGFSEEVTAYFEGVKGP